ncbi:hypothetical protein K5V07_01960 [Flavobacterium sp. CHNK8]|uniref:hypothetical protein n=1 Tax=Flavobacterium sp. CHNK8 TaxID=2871165 RepID=UPI001C8E4D0E|nr:hypothetical protein [Flavobacterium sp. CHNK8]QZK89321.1 hypothetical protein K5V07_01960 [Flavobacterium sp. CHNK8]
MSENLIFPIVIHPTATKLENYLILFLVAFIFLPFTYGVFTQQGIYCWSLVIGFFGLMTFNYFSDYKFTTLKIIQKDKFIDFSEQEVKIWENNKYDSYDWNALKNIEIYLIAYKNKWDDDDSQYQGIENYVSFTLNDETHKHLFYVHTSKEFNFLSDYFEKIILPNLYESKIIKDESVIITKLDYTELQRFKVKYDINRYTDYIHFN